MPAKEESLKQILFRVTLVHAGPVRREEVIDNVAEFRRTDAGTILLRKGSGWREIGTAQLVYMDVIDMETAVEQEKAAGGSS